MAQIQLAGTAALVSVTSTPDLFPFSRSDYARQVKCTIPAFKG